jgi:hypothetical protein
MKSWKFRFGVLVVMAALATYFTQRALTRPIATVQSDAVRLIGTWHATLLPENTPVHLTWINREGGYITERTTPTGSAIVGSGDFQAQEGEWKTTNAYGPVDEGTYHFMDDNNVVMEGEAGNIIVWTRDVSKDASTKSSNPNQVTGFVDDLKLIE